ncbi:MAG: hypothetical protein FJZ79_01845 [Chlorobi bacterium]|nr:hypothetical protein [Chlorobiota bacterium]
MFVFRFRFLTIVNLITFFVFANISIFQAGEPAAASASLGREENYAWLEAQQIQGYGFRVRGLKKGEIEMELAAMAHNIARMAG